MLSTLASRRLVPSDPSEYVAFCIVERPNAPSAWVRCGSAEVNADGSLRVRLDVLPLSGELHLRPPFAPSHATRSTPPVQPSPLPF